MRILESLALVPAAAILATALPACGSGSGAKRPAPRPADRRLVLIDAKTGAVDHDFPDANGRISAISSDGKGGWYVGGDFDHIGLKPRNGLAHLRSDGTLERGFVPALPSGASTEAILYHGGVVYARAWPIALGVVAIDATTGARLWRVSLKNGYVNSLVYWRGTLFVSGNFWRIGGVLRKGVAALDAKTGKPMPWHIRLTKSRGAMSPMFGPIAISRGILYLTGDFYRVNHVERRCGLAAVSARTGHLTSWRPRCMYGDDFDKIVLEVARGQVLTGTPSVFDAGTAAHELWWRRLEGYATSFAVSGDTVYIGGDSEEGFSEAGGKPANNLASVVLPEGRFTSWRPNLGRCVNVKTLGVSGNEVLVGGDFTQAPCPSDDY
jgi:outer membrane protein assembly factor BamB